MHAQIPSTSRALRHCPTCPRCALPDWTTKGSFTSITRTADELSVVCPAENLPADIHSPHDWICLKLEGPFHFSQTGVLFSFIAPLSNNRIPIFAISSYDTDYVLIPYEHSQAAVDLLCQAGHEPLEE